MKARMKKLLGDTSAIATMLAMEFGYKAHERGISLEQARDELFTLVAPDAPTSNIDAVWDRR